jgi:chromosome segregation ATPase
MIFDSADMAILETYTDRMNPVELGLVEEVRRLHDEAEEIEELRAKVEGLEEELSDAKSRLDDAQEEVEDLQWKLDAAESAARQSEQAHEFATRALDELKTSIRELVS